MKNLHFIDEQGTFSMSQPENHSYLYFPIAGEQGIKSSFTPNFGGDSKLNQNAFLLEPVSSENLHNNRSGRNFWCNIKDTGCWSAVGQSAEAEAQKFTKDQDESVLTAGFMWQTVTRTSKKYEMKAEVTSFIPQSKNVEIMQITITNVGDGAKEIIPVAAVPIYGRSADNLRDHRHVTSLLHRIRTTKNGVYVKPTLSFDERGHQKNNLTYFVCGSTGEGENPVSFYPGVDEFLGEGGCFTSPRAVLENQEGLPSGSLLEGTEAVGGLRFEQISLEKGESKSYTILIGVTEEEEQIAEIAAEYNTKEAVDKELEQVKTYWQNQVNVAYHTNDSDFDNYMKWVSFQPILRRIYGCSFLPHHDYGKGGRGWRDLWQDCLALLIMDPSNVRKMILDNFGGVRMDGTNATIIGERPGQFIADRNHITRVWMDHGMWPFLTTKLYIDQTGDVEILKQPVLYFKDGQVERGTAHDSDWNDAYGNWQKDDQGNVYEGSVLEHLLLQHICSFYEVGEHNYMRLRGADWNDAIDLAEERGESVAFTCAYAGNLRDIAKLVRDMVIKEKALKFEILEEMQELICSKADVWNDISKKKELLAAYTAKCRHQVSGRKVQMDALLLADCLEEKADWMMQQIRENEWITDVNGDGWFNSYYDNHGNAVEGIFEHEVRMMLTGQVFAVMSKTADAAQTKAICNSADRYLYRREVGGYRLNTNFHEEKYDMGRMFGFAYGEKENGAVFSHMTVMYANALYQNGFVEEGHKALQTLADTALDFNTSHIYPGIPEYFNAKGRGLYHYLTGAASWYMLTMVTQVFGVRGEYGSLLLEPKLKKDQFDENGVASIKLEFAGKTLVVEYQNKDGKEYGSYEAAKAVLDGQTEVMSVDSKLILSRDLLEELGEGEHKIVVSLI